MFQLSGFYCRPFGLDVMVQKFGVSNCDHEKNISSYAYPQFKVSVLVCLTPVSPSRCKLAEGFRKEHVLSD